jgi:hypothetical protein
MNYYKEKYGEGKPDKGAGSETSRGGDAKQKPQNPRVSKSRNSRSSRAADGRHSSDAVHSASSKKDTAVQGGALPAERDAAPKKGVVSKLLGIFKKKEN